MAHDAQKRFVTSIRAAFFSYFQDKRVLEIGSLDINGSVRSMFDNCEYIGLDVAAGPGVDVVAQGQDYDAPDGSFDTVICCEVMEHNPHWVETFENMIRLCRPGGLIIMSCGGAGRAEHGTTRTTVSDSPLTIGMGWEYYHNLTASEVMRRIPLGQSMKPYGFMYNHESSDLYFVGFRRGGEIVPAAERSIRTLQRYYIVRNVPSRVRALKRQVLIHLVGEQRYNAGPVRFW